MKILVATGIYPPDIGGPATYSKLLADRLPAMGIQVDVLSYGSVRKYPKIIRHKIYALKVLWHGRAADIVFAQDVASVGLPALVATLILGKTFMVRVPGDYAWEQAKRFGVTDGMNEFQDKKYGWRVELMRKLERLVVGQADKVIVPSKSFAEVVKKWVKDPEKVVAVYNGIDLTEIDNLTRGSVARPRTIISAGRLVAGKGFAELVMAMKKLPGYKLEIAGDGPEAGKLKETIDREGLSDRVTLLGRLERPELLRRIAKSESFVLNTRFESFSYQIVEAMAAGTPVIAARVGSIPELIDDGKSGILYKSGDQAGLARAIERISSDKPLATGISAEAKRKAASFSITSTLEAVKKIVLSLRDKGMSDDPSHKRRVFLAKILRYIFSGGMAAVTDLTLLYVATDIFGIWYLLSSILAFLVAFVVSFVLQKFFTFQDHGMDGVHGQAAIYLCVTGTNLALNTGMIYLLVQYADLHYMPAQILTSILIAIESFVVYQIFVFKKPVPVKAS